MAGGQLAPRELQVLHLLACGATDREVAQLLGMATGTARAHVTSIRGKLGCGSRTEAVVLALQIGMFSLDDVWVGFWRGNGGRDAPMQVTPFRVVV